MAVNGNICIFRDGTETSAVEGDKIEFDTSATNGASTIPDARSHVDNYSVTMTLVTQENPVPDSNNPSGLQDTGLATVLYELTGYFDGTSGTPEAIEDFRNWQREDKTTTAKPLGRYGIRSDTRPEYNVAPSATYGLILEHFEVHDEYEYQGRTMFTVKLRYNGAINGLGA